MGLPDDYILPDNYNEVCHLTGDGVVVPAVRFLADALIEPRGLAQSRRGEADSPGNIVYFLLMVAIGRLDRVGGRLALRRSNSPEDIAGLALFMASDAARNVTGQSWNVDGGLVND